MIMGCLITEHSFHCPGHVRRDAKPLLRNSKFSLILSPTSHFSKLIEIQLHLATLPGYAMDHDQTRLILLGHVEIDNRTTSHSAYDYLEVPNIL